MVDALFEELEAEFQDEDEVDASIYPPETFSFAENVRQTVRPFLRKIFIEEGLKEQELDYQRSWSLLWANKVPSLSAWPSTTNSGRFYKANHFPMTAGINLTHKGHLYSHYARMRSIAPNLYNFIPEAVLLPLPENELAHLFDQIQPNDPPFVQKPVNASRGDGFSLVNSSSAVTNTSQFLLQHYLDPIDLIDGRKYHVRLFLLITSLDPPRAYLHSAGYIKKAFAPYTRPVKQDIHSHDDCYNVHVTNHREGNVYDKDPFMSLDELYENLRHRGTDLSTVRANVDRILALTIASVVDKMLDSDSHHDHSFKIFGASPYLNSLDHSFEIFGVDLLFGQDFKPWLMEVNLSPSLDIESSPVLKPVKEAMIRDAIRLAVTRPIPATFNLSRKHEHTETNRRNWIISETALELANLGGFVPLLPRSDLWQLVRPFISDRQGHAAAIHELLSI